MDILNPLDCHLCITNNQPTIIVRGVELPHYDAIIPRFGAALTAYGVAVVRQFEQAGTFCVNGATAIRSARDKYQSLQMLAQAGVPVPNTGYASHSDLVHDLVSRVGGAPLVVKLLEGDQGIGVVLADSDISAQSIVEAFHNQNCNILVQEFLSDAKGADIRCFVVGNQVVAAMKRQASAGEFRSNLHRGGHAETVELTEQERRVAIQAAKAIELNVCGVDILQTSKGPVVMEVNTAPGIEGIETTTGEDVVSVIWDLIERKTWQLSAPMEETMLGLERNQAQGLVSLYR